MIDKEIDLKKKYLQELIDMRKNNTFSSKEKRVWGARKGLHHLSNKEDDYYQKVRDEDFLSKPIIPKRS
jgi:hypothetical protein